MVFFFDKLKKWRADAINAYEKGADLKENKIP